MPANIVNNTPTKVSEEQALQIISGAGACRLVQGGDPAFVQQGIVAIVPNEPSEITSLLANDKASTEVSGNTDPTDLNVAGATLGQGAYIVPHTYELGKSFRSVTCSTGSIWVYYNEVPNNN